MAVVNRGFTIDLNWVVFIGNTRRCPRGEYSYEQDVSSVVRHTVGETNLAGKTSPSARVGSTYSCSRSSTCPVREQRQRDACYIKRCAST